MTSTPTAPAAPAWHALRDGDSRAVEARLRADGFTADAYRYNAASIRVRVTDSWFAGMSAPDRYDLVDKMLERLSPRLQSDVLFALPVAPGDETHPRWAAMCRAFDTASVEEGAA